eukprot:CAMPEP_0117568888 /NCGR_PEP_ID=MMETSP0784-20121206/58374_1 /TAXON_ID=39447 /ORGANISM="" /LENGTH=98 /DNA_ID=CAMNT_0005366843 /DNA_START=138 /DNA_END=434 /DNA_ORIENTATION=-
MLTLRSVALAAVTAVIAACLQGCGGDCSEKGCVYDDVKVTNESQPLDDRKEVIDAYIQCTKSNDCCAPVGIADKMSEHAKNLDHAKQEVEDMVKCNGR